MLVNDDYGILFCYVPKVGCSNWKRVIMVLDGWVDDPETVSGKPLDVLPIRLTKFSNEQVEYRLKYYKKFMFVRNPLDRIISAYKDKLTGDNDYYQAYRVNWIIDKFRAENQRANGSKGATLEEFFKFLSTRDPADMDNHWMPFKNLCQPCAIDYDFIGKIENLKEDADEILRRLNLSEIVKYPRKQSVYIEKARHMPSTADLLSQLPLSLIQAVLKIFEEDFELFLYHNPYSV
ncbi:carbohydrate sulfotransferase 14 [Nematostella vectensis]|nr:carbohydrate sulfotransferase 14 [Nematostella vectensis]